MIAEVIVRLVKGLELLLVLWLLELVGRAHCDSHHRRKVGMRHVE
jgi:hypothetical protein